MIIMRRALESIYIFVVFCVLVGGAAWSQDSISIEMKLSHETIALNQQATLGITISALGQQQLPQPKLPPLPYFDVTPAGSSTNLQIINGQVTYSQSYNYLLSPKKVGQWPIRAATVVFNGKRYESNELHIKVVQNNSGATSNQQATPSTRSSGGGEDVFLTASFNKKQPYVDEQVTLTVKFYRAVRLLDSPNYTPPPMPGFWVQDMPPQTQYYETISGRDYLVTEIRTALFPTKPGELKIGPAQVTTAVAKRTRQRGRDPFSLLDDMFMQGERITVKSDPLTVMARSLPKDGKPDDFTGAVGTYTISADVDNTDIQVNEAIALTIKISGKGNVKSIPEPILPELDGFRIEKASSDFKTSHIDDVIGGTKTFEYVMIPRLPGTHTLPPIKLNYFDPGSKRYRTVETKSIDFAVKQGELVAGDEVPYNMVSGQTIDLKETDIRFIKTQDVDFHPRGRILLTSPVFLTMLALPLMVLLGGVVDVRRRRKLEGDVAYARLRKANALARKRLKTAEGLIRGADPTPFYAEISTVLTGYIADKLNMSPHGFTGDMIDDELSRRSVDEDLRISVKDILTEADFGRFAGGDTGVEARQHLYDQTRDVVVRLEGVLK